LNQDAETDTRLDTLRQLVSQLADAIGPDCEVVLHDLRALDQSIVAMSGNVTGRQLGSPMTDLGLRILREGGSRSSFLNYSAVGADGRSLRCSTFIIRGSRGKPVALVCVNFDISEWQRVRSFLDTHAVVVPPPGGGAADASTESFPRDVQDVFSSVIASVVSAVGKPVTRWTRAERVAAVRSLDRAGLFAVKGAHYRVAALLGVSRYTVYNYLNYTRHSSGDDEPNVAGRTTPSRQDTGARLQGDSPRGPASLDPSCSDRPASTGM
jgi:predicted transcriptional regulator YheO